jgi:Na+/H+ antiporter NhaA
MSASTANQTRLRFPQVAPQVRRFLATEAGGAALLLAAAVLALIWANSPWSASYDDLLSTDLRLGLGSVGIEMDVHHWVNDAAMAIFFLVVGLEINREISVGELRDKRSVAIPTLGALGGLVLPALIYLAFNPSGEAARGWGVAMSTDTAFVIGILALFGPRCPDRLRLFVLTLAIVDDLGAISVMALFYTDDLDLAGLAVAAGIFGAMLVLRRAGVWQLWPYVLLALALWLAVYGSGVHATLAGVLAGLAIPSRATRTSVGPAPSDRLQTRLHPWSAFVVIPIFGLANAGVSLSPEALREASTSSVTIGIAVALVVGNAVGIFAAAGLAIRTGLGVLPGRVRFGHLLGGAILAGIGFTIALFITELAFEDEALVAQAKIGILTGSLVAAILGTLVLRFFGERSSLCSPLADELPAELPAGPWIEPSRTS